MRFGVEIDTEGAFPTFFSTLKEAMIAAEILFAKGYRGMVYDYQKHKLVHTF